MKKFVAIIPVKEQSQRVHHKNLRPFAGKSLFEHKLDVVRRLDVDDVIVNTDSEELIEKAKSLGLSYHRRDPYFASPECSNSEYHEYLARVTEAEHFLVAQVTAPMVTEATFKKAIEIYQTGKYDSVMSTKKIKEFLWYDNQPVNYTLEDAPNSQDLPDYFMPTFGVIICNRSVMQQCRNFISPNPYFMEVSDLEAIDIDTDLDFEFAEFLF